MRYRALDSNGDMQFGNGQKNFLINTPATVAQAFVTWFKLFLGEWYLNINDGVPYFEGVLGEHSQATADQTLIAQARGVTGVVGIDNWKSTVDPTTRLYSSLSAKLTTVYGETPVQITYSGDF